MTACTTARWRAARRRPGRAPAGALAPGRVTVVCRCVIQPAKSRFQPGESSAWSPWAAPGMRSIPRSSRPALRTAAGSWPTTRRTLTSSWSTPAASSRRPSRSPSTSCSTRRRAARKVVAAGCLAERYGSGLAEAMPEAQILSFDDYEDIAARLDAVAAGPAVGRARAAGPAHAAAAVARGAPAGPACTACLRPRGQRGGDRRPAARCRPGLRPAGAAAAPRRRRGRAAQDRVRLRPPLHASAPSRHSAARSCPAARRTCWPRPSWLADHGARELLLVSENSTSYGKDLGDLQAA